MRSSFCGSIIVIFNIFRPYLILLMRLSLTLSLKLNKITGLSSMKSMSLYYKRLLILVALTKTSLSVLRQEYFSAGTSFAVWGVLYCGCHIIELRFFQRDFWESVERNYSPNTIMIIPYVMPDRILNHKWFMFKFWSICGLIFFPISIILFINTEFYDGFQMLLSSTIFLACALWESNYFFYHEINKKSLWSRIKDWAKEKMSNRAKVLTPMPVPA